MIYLKTDVKNAKSLRFFVTPMVYFFCELYYFSQTKIYIQHRIIWCICFKGVKTENANLTKTLNSSIKSGWNKTNLSSNKQLTTEQSWALAQSRARIPLVFALFTCKRVREKW